MGNEEVSFFVCTSGCEGCPGFPCAVALGRSVLVLHAAPYLLGPKSSLRAHPAVVFKELPLWALCLSLRPVIKVETRFELVAASTGVRLLHLCTGGPLCP